MPKFFYKDEVALAYDENKKRIRLEGRVLLDRLLNAALHEMTERFNAALARGEILRVGRSEDELREIFRASVLKSLEPAKDHVDEV